MQDEFKELFLNGMSLSHFIFYYAMGLIGILMFFLVNLYSAIKTDPKTPPKWSWRAFLRGGIRLLLSLASLALAVLYFKELSPYIFNTTDGIQIDINGFSSFMLGVLIDRLWKSLMSADKTLKLIAKK